MSKELDGVDYFNRMVDTAITHYNSRNLVKVGVTDLTKGCARCLGMAFLGLLEHRSPFQSQYGSAALVGSAWDMYVKQAVETTADFVDEAGGKWFMNTGKVYIDTIGDFEIYGTPDAWCFDHPVEGTGIVVDLKTVGASGYMRFNSKNIYDSYVLQVNTYAYGLNKAIAKRYGDKVKQPKITKLAVRADNREGKNHVYGTVRLDYDEAKVVALLNWAREVHDKAITEGVAVLQPKSGCMNWQNH